MERRDFLKGGLAAGAIGTLTAAGALASSARAAEAADSESGAALAALRDAIAEIEAGFASPAWRLQGATDLAEARRYLLHTLQHACECWLEADAARPAFKRFITPEKKLLGDNPDAEYHTAAVSADHRYRIRGNLAGATYTSFTVELGSGEGGNSTGLGAALNDTQFEARSDGSYELFVGGEERPRNWIPLPEGSGSVTVRHYYERDPSISRDRMHHIPIVIENAEDPGPAPPPSDASVARGIGRVTNFLKTTIQPPMMDTAATPFVSTVPNQLPAPKRGSTGTETGFAAVDNVYAMCPVVLKPDEALVVRGRYPRCRFANVVLWNRFMQTLDFMHRDVSLNRKQTKLEADGSFKVVVAARDPGVPNWIDNEGRMVTTMFWRFLLPEEEIEPLTTKVVPIAEVAAS